MNPHRLRRLSISACLSACLASFCASPASLAAEAAGQHADKGPAPADTSYLSTLKSGHPRLFADSARFAALQLRTDGVSLRLRALVLADADKKLGAPPRVYPEGLQNMSNARAVQGDILALALAFRLTGDKRYAARAKAHLLQISELRDWGRPHFLDVGETALAAAVGYDWLYDTLDEGERTRIVRAIADRALAASLEVQEGPNSWLNGSFNWNPVCHGGLVAAALAIGDREPALAERVIARAVHYLPIAGASYSPDGGQAEGPSYWSYGTTFYVLAIEALRSALGSSQGLEAIPGVLGTADFRRQLVGPSGQDFNYSDYHDHSENEPAMLWFARENRRPELAREELATLEKMHAGQAQVNYSRLTPFELLWWQPGADKGALPALQWSADGHMPIGVMRSAWNDPLATWVAIKGGTPNYSHGHMDVGSFVLEAQGVRWALDLGAESYNKMRAAKLDLWNYTQDSNRWTTFRAGPEGHNILRFDGARQRIDGHGTVKALPVRAGTRGFVADLGSLYAGAAAGVTRTVRLHPDRSVSIEDRWRGVRGKQVPVSFQWLTLARVTAVPAAGRAGPRLRLEQGGRALAIAIAERDAELRIDDVSAPPGVQNSPNPGLRRIVITRRAGAGRDGGLTLKVTPLGSAGPAR